MLCFKVKFQPIFEKKKNKLARDNFCEAIVRRIIKADLHDILSLFFFGYMYESFPGKKKYFFAFSMKESSLVKRFFFGLINILKQDVHHQ